jgi:hypothetical protein
MGEEVTFEIKIENTGGSNIEIPWTPSLADLEPSDSTLSYSYLDATVYLSLIEPDSHQSLDLFRDFYGSKDLPWTVRELRPKQFIVIRARVRLDTDEEWLNKKLKEAQPLPLKASADFRLGMTIYSPNANGDSGSESTACVPLVIKRANQLDLALWPGGTK